ncbi:PREDICTED: L-lactate dehydrogenase B chain-like [Acropora digitifera]|uniref:L-lactate dehydrogenase B chain-like n=1 Tax=Acropora digitifera TaxID=70779 RepID=UPI00077A4A88|nr:PREDICTED: L-lactate dehydrogenase B chain-like [Acropora digitifera]
MASVKDQLFDYVHVERGKPPHVKKVTVVGVGQVGMACAYSIMQQGICRELALVDVVEDKLKGELLDLQHGQRFVKNIDIQASTDYAISANSDVCIVTAGCRQKEGESRRNLVQRNVNIFKAIIPQLVKYSPNTVLMIVSNPGTSEKSADHKFMKNERLARVVFAVPVWSGVNIGGVNLKSLNPAMGSDEDPEKWSGVHEKVVNSAYEVIKKKGYTSWAIGLSVANMTQTLLRNQKNVHAISVLAKGFHGIENEVFLSLPSVLGAEGVICVIKQTLDENEVKKLQNCARTMHEIQETLEF